MLSSPKLRPAAAMAKHQPPPAAASGGHRSSTARSLQLACCAPPPQQQQPQQQPVKATQILLGDLRTALTEAAHDDLISQILPRQRDQVATKQQQQQQQSTLDHNQALDQESHFESHAIPIPRAASLSSSLSSSDIDAAAAPVEEDLIRGPSPAEFEGPPRVPESEDCPLSLSWVHELPDAAIAPRCVGKIHVVMGPMFAGKSTALLNQVERHQSGGLRVAVVKSDIDDRYARSWVVTHDGRRARCFTAPTLEAFRQRMGPLLGKFHAIAIDEAQFFPDLLEFSLEQAEVHGRDVVVAGLSCDYLRRSFGDLVHLVPHAHTIERLKAKCFYCSQPAPYTVRVVGQGAQQLVGGSDIYRPACARCYHDCNADRHQSAATHDCSSVHA